MFSCYTTAAVVDVDLNMRRSSYTQAIHSGIELGWLKLRGEIKKSQPSTILQLLLTILLQKTWYVYASVLSAKINIMGSWSLHRWKLSLNSKF